MSRRSKRAFPGAGEAVEAGSACQTVTGSADDARPVGDVPSGFSACGNGIPHGSIDIRGVATQALLAVAANLDAPAAARAQAARTLLELVGALGPGRVPDTAARPVSEMTLAEIDDEIRASGA